MKNEESNQQNILRYIGVKVINEVNVVKWRLDRIRNSISRDQIKLRETTGEVNLHTRSMRKIGLMENLYNDG